MRSNHEQTRSFICHSLTSQHTNHIMFPKLVKLLDSPNSYNKLAKGIVHVFRKKTKGKPNIAS